MAVTPSECRILIVDDNLMNIQVVGEMLRSKGYKIEVALNGYEALQVAEKKRPDLILLDIMMPGMDGYEVCDKLKAAPSTQEIPIIFLTAKAETEDIVKGFRVGGFDYIVKPFKKEEVFVRIDNQLELKKAKDTIAKQNIELSEVNSTKDKFISIISHDLRNPTSNLLSLSSMLADSYDSFSEEERKEYVMALERSSQKVYDLLENLLSWAVSKSGKIECTPRRIAVQGLLEENVGLVVGQAKVKGVNVYNKYVGPIEVFADHNLSHTIIRNLLTNALKFTPAGGEVFTHVSQTDSMIEISVTDTGIGMSEDDLQKLFRIDVKNSSIGKSTEKGTGLGLILCKEFAELQGGSIAVQSSLGKGTTFSIKLPLQAH